MSYTITPVTTARQLNEFIRVPVTLYANNPHWITPLDIERKGILDPKQNPYFDHAEAQYWIATDDKGRPVGRISAQIDQLSLEANHPTTGHFGMLAAIEDQALVEALLDTAKDWLKARGMTAMQGPFNLSINQELGILVDGFDTPPMMMMPHDPPYLGALVEAAGLRKVKDLLAYIRSTHDYFPERFRRLAERSNTTRISMRMLNMKNYDKEIQDLVCIYNEGWHTNWGFVPMTEKEVAHMASELKPLIKDELAWFADIDGEPAAFIVCLPDINDAIADLNGKLLPFGWAKLLWRLKVKGVSTARVLLMGVRKKHSEGMLGKIMPFRLIYALEQCLYDSSIKRVEMSWILEDNMPVRRMIESLGGEAYKTYRMYETDI